MSRTVLVTGGTGFIGGWTIVELLKRGYSVRTTVRCLDNEPAVRAGISANVDPGDRLALFDRPMQFMTPLLGRKHVFTSAKARAVLGWMPRPAATTIVDSARSAIEIGAI